VPGPARLDIRAIAGNAERSGRGIVTKCGRCKSLVEVIQHG
jgi:hypothetical protein